MADRYMTQFINKLNTIHGKEYLTARIAYWAAPTIAGKKPSTLLNFVGDTKGSYYLFKSYGNEICKLFGLSYFVLWEKASMISVLFYDEDLLYQSLFSVNHWEYLTQEGYMAYGNLKNVLHTLKERYQDEIPHEIGIFLGIPRADVQSFIYKNGKECLLNGYWKVYHNLEDTKALFRDYDLVRNITARYFIRHSR